jgi:hypothetical protein
MRTNLLLLLPLLSACSDYEFAGGAYEAGGEGDSAGDGSSTDNPLDDPCYEPEDGYTENPAARLFVTGTSAPLVATLEGSDAGFENELWIDAPESQLLFRAWDEPSGTFQSLGPYAIGSEVVLGIEVTDNGNHFTTGPGTGNSDGFTHVSVTYEGACTWRVGFEDEYGGGDQDFDDAVMRISGPLMQEQ